MLQPIGINVNWVVRVIKWVGSNPAKSLGSNRPMPRIGFLNRNTTDIWGWVILCGGGCPVPCKMFRRIRDFYWLAAGSSWPPKMSPDVAKYPLGAKFSPVDNHQEQYLSNDNARIAENQILVLGTECALILGEIRTPDGTLSSLFWAYGLPACLVSYVLSFTK